MKLKRFILPIITGLAVAACSETASVDLPQTEGGTIALSAYTDEGGSVGTRVTDGSVVSGSYYLSFTNAAGDLQTVSAPFEGGTGYPWVNGAGLNGEGEALHWGYIQRPASGNHVTLYLDNVAGETTENLVTLDGDVYQASVYDAATSTNDIVWGGNTAVPYNSPNVFFTLSHRMACVRVNIQVDTSDGGDEDVLNSITQDGVTVSLLGVRYKASQFNRTNGNVTENPTETKDIKLHDGPLQDDGYTSTWIFPPQSFNNSYRPTLQIKLKDESNTTYEGGLPESMFGNDNYSGTASDLAFSADQRLTINVKLVTSIENREILFLPAIVENWNHLDPISIISPQLGIYSDEDYAAVVSAYNQEGVIDTETMQRYATYDEASGKWIVNIFAKIGEEGTTPIPQFNNNTNITLVFNGWTVYGKDASSQSELFTTYTDPDADEENQPTEEEVQS